MPTNQSFTVLNIFSTFVASTSTVSNATIDLYPYFSVMRREISMVYTVGIQSTSSETVTFRLEEADSTATAGSTTVTFSAIAGSSVTSTALGSSAVQQALTSVVGLQLTKRYLRCSAVGSAATAVLPIAVAIVMRKRSA